MRKNPKLSIIILSYNTRELLLDCVTSLEKVKNEADLEIIVVDNASTDGSPEVVKKFGKLTKLIENDSNLGFARGNNRARDIARGEYILFLNSDTIVHRGAIQKSIEYLENNPKVSALTCKVLLPDGSLDKDTRRSFPTPWVSLTHLVLGLDKFYPKSPLFSKYWYGYLDPDEIHEVDVIQGAFFLSRKEKLDEVGWFDEDYFLDGEDVDLCWKLKQHGGRIVYYPAVSITHLKGASKGKNQATKSKVSLTDKIKYRLAGVNSMEIFYKKRLWDKYPLILNMGVVLSIEVLKMIRLIRILI